MGSARAGDDRAANEVKINSCGTRERGVTHLLHQRVHLLVGDELFLRETGDESIVVRHVRRSLRAPRASRCAPRRGRCSIWQRAERHGVTNREFVVFAPIRWDKSSPPCTRILVPVLSVLNSYRRASPLPRSISGIHPAHLSPRSILMLPRWGIAPPDGFPPALSAPSECPRNFRDASSALEHSCPSLRHEIAHPPRLSPRRVRLAEHRLHHSRRAQ